MDESTKTPAWVYPVAALMVTLILAGLYEMVDVALTMAHARVCLGAC